MLSHKQNQDICIYKYLVFGMGIQYRVSCQLSFDATAKEKVALVLKDRQLVMRHNSISERRDPITTLA